MRAPSLNDLNDDLLLGLGVPAAAILHYPEVTRRTADEVLAVHRLLRRRPEIRSLLLVTSGHHSQRAARLFGRCLGPLGIRVAVHPPRHHRYDPLHYWRRPEDLRATVTELLSFIHDTLFSRCPAETGSRAEAPR